MAEINVTNDNFEAEVMNSDIPVLVDFWATWCGPCQMVGPIVAGIAEKYQGKIKVCKVNVDEEEELAGKYMVMSIPTLLAIKDGQQIGKRIGVCSEEDMLAMFDI